MSTVKKRFSETEEKSLQDLQEKIHADVRFE